MASRRMPADGPNTSNIKAAVALRPAIEVAVINQPDRPSKAMPATTVRADNAAPSSMVAGRASSSWRNRGE